MHMWSWVSFQIQTFKDIIMQKDNKLAEINQQHEQELFKLAAKSDASADLEQVITILTQWYNNIFSWILPRVYQMVLFMLYEYMLERDIDPWYLFQISFCDVAFVKLLFQYGCCCCCSSWRPWNRSCMKKKRCCWERLRSSRSSRGRWMAETNRLRWVCCGTAPPPFAVWYLFLCFWWNKWQQD